MVSGASGSSWDGISLDTGFIEAAQFIEAADGRVREVRLGCDDGIGKRMLAWIDQNTVGVIVPLVGAALLSGTGLWAVLALSIA
jgi:hypothetical protein